MADLAKIIDEILAKEGTPTNDPDDRGGRTAYGISEKSNPLAWADSKVTEGEARAIYERKYIKFPKFDQVKDHQLQVQLIDFGVTSGPQLAIMKLQAILNVEVDGEIGPKTLHALDGIFVPSINNRLVGARVTMIGRIVKRNPSDIKYLVGWLERAVEFLL